MSEKTVDPMWAVEVATGREPFPELLDTETLEKIGQIEPLEDSDVALRYLIPDAVRPWPWRDFQVQNGARAFLKQEVLPFWISNHPHRPCSNIRVDEWGRALCRYITPTQIGVDGPWENPTHFLFYAYNNALAWQRYNTDLNNFLRTRYNIENL